MARRSDVIFTMLPASPEVRSVVLGSVLPNSKPGALIVDMSTIDSLTTDEIAAAAVFNPDAHNRGQDTAYLAPCSRWWGRIRFPAR